LYPFVLTYVCSLFLLKLVSFETFCLSSTASCYKSCTKYRYLSVITTSQYKAFTKCFPLLLRTTKLAQRYFPVLLCTTILAQSTSRWYGHVMMLWFRGWC
jgi:hypothetical protein